LAVAVDGANRPDCKLLEATLSNVQIAGPEPEQEEQNLCLDKGFDYPFVEDLVAGYGYTAHIRSRGEEKQDLEQIPGYRARRWVVERTHSWMNRFRRLLIRWEKKKANYLAMLHLACAFITFRAAGVLG
jgi:putative transposase